MPKAASAGMKTHIALQHIRMSGCWQVKQRNGIIKGFTEFDEDVLVDLGDGDGLITYRAKTGYSRTAIKSTYTFAVDNLNVLGFLDPDDFDQNDILAGRYNFAEIKMFQINWDNLANGVVRMRRGYLGDVTVLETSFEAQLRGLLERYNDEIVGVNSPNCRADLGDLPGFSPSIHGCKVRLDPPLWVASTVYTVRPPRDAGLGSVVKPTAFNDRHFKCIADGTSDTTEPSWNLTIGGSTSDGSVTWETEQALTVETSVNTVTDNLHFTVTYTGDAPDALLEGGLAKFIDGQNAGENVEIETWDLATRAIILSLPVSHGVYPITAGDLVQLLAGCAKTLVACQSFDNIYNPRAEWHVPGAKVTLRTPDVQ